MNLNTVLAAVSWDLTEPEEGKFDFSLVDGIIQAARRHHLRLVLLWFGSWKNGMSTYAPGWVKTNSQRFPRAQDKDGSSLDVLSTLSGENRDADAKAFAAFMRHVREVDGENHTVLMIQVENEVGLLTDSRDRSAVANRTFRQPVPKELMEFLQTRKDELVPGFRKRWEAAGFKTSGSWEDVFGTSIETNEIFMAWNYARYVGRIAAVGKAEYPLPMFVNTGISTWSETTPLKPQDWLSGGSMPHMLDVWRAGAPQIDIFSPDIYSYFNERLPEYHLSWNPLFIPEMGRDAHFASDIFNAIGQHAAIGVSPFGIESVPLFQEELSNAYAAIAQIAPAILEGQSKGKIGAVVLDKDHPNQDLRVGDYTLHLGIARHYTFPTPDYPAGIFIQTGTDEYLVAGRGLSVGFSPNTSDFPVAGFISVEDGAFVNGTWVVGRRLNGDEILSGKGLRLRGDRYMVQRVKLYRYR
jgi:hypothetical protein